MPVDKEEAIKENLDSWDELASVHAQGSGAEFYRIEQWLAGESKLAPWEIEEVGPVVGKSLLHLQCHIGTDSVGRQERWRQIVACTSAARRAGAARQRRPG